MQCSPRFAILPLLAVVFWSGTACGVAPPDPLLLEAQEGSKDAEFRLGLRYFQNRDPAGKNLTEALRWFNAAAQQRNASAEEYLGVMYQGGLGVPQNYEQAAQWYLKAAGQGSLFAPVFLGELYESGKGVPQSYAEAAKWYLKAANNGNSARGQWHLGLLYYQGNGVPQNLDEAVKWERKAAEHNYHPAINMLGMIYSENGNYPEAVRWFGRAASQGDVGAQVKLADIYYEGHPGVDRNYNAAAQWYQSAATAGNPEAQNRISQMYYDGRGVPRDYVAAYMWASFSAAQDNYDGRKILDNLEFVMSSEQKAEAQKMARDYRRKGGDTPFNIFLR